MSEQKATRNTTVEMKTVTTQVEVKTEKIVIETTPEVAGLLYALLRDIANTDTSLKHDNYELYNSLRELCLPVVKLGTPNARMLTDWSVE